MVLKASNAQIESVALIRDIEKQYGSLANVPDDDERLLKIRALLDNKPGQKVKKVKKSVIPTIVVKDNGVKPVHSKCVRYKETYELMLKDQLPIREACQITGIIPSSFNNFLYNRKAYTIYYAMEFKGRTLRGRTANDVLNEAKKQGYRYRINNAVKNHDLRRKIVLNPIIFRRPTPLKSR